MLSYLALQLNENGVIQEVTSTKRNRNHYINTLVDIFLSFLYEKKRKRKTEKEKKP